MIPKKIHYCWFSGENYPDDIKKYLDSWKIMLPDYEFVHWDAIKARSTGLAWVIDALNEKRWAFASDAVRLYALYNEGGIYLDTDVELLKSFDDLLERKNFFGFENGSRRIEGAVLGSEPQSPAIASALAFYQTHKFNFEESKVDELVLPNILSKTFSKIPNIEIFPEHVFSPKNYTDGSIKVNLDTFCIHHFSSSWRSEAVRKGIVRRQWLYKTFPRPIAKLLAKVLSVWTNLQNLGLIGTLKKIAKKLHHSK